MVDLTQPRTALHVTNAARQLSLVTFRGAEEISKAYRFSLRAEGPVLDANAITTHYVGRPAHLCLQRGTESERWVHGVVLSVRARGQRADRLGAHIYELQLGPRFRLLGHKKRSRIFQDLSVPRIVAAVLEESAILWEGLLSRTYSARAYVVQHQETDLHFIDRLLAEEGIFYFFDHPPGSDASERLILADTPAALAPISGSPHLRVQQDAGMAEADDRDVHEFGLERKVKSDRWMVKDYDYFRPAFAVRGDALVKTDDAAVADPRSDAAQSDVDVDPRSDALEQYSHHGELEAANVDSAVAVTRLEQTRRKLWVATGQTCNARLLPGHTAEISDVQVDGRKSSYTIFSVKHEGYEPIERTVSRTKPPYANRFQAVPAATPFRPRPPPPRTQQVMETATVVGPSNEEIHTDELGRIKVQFHWDREGKLDDHSSCWIRVVQPWAGAGWGFQFIPRVGMEVMVTFLVGDTDRPVVVGCLNNVEHPPPFKLPEEKTRSGIRTRTTPRGGGYNEISFQDAAGGENFFIHAQGQLTEEIRASRQSTVGQDCSLAVDGDHQIAVGGNTNINTSGSSVDNVGVDRAVVTTGRSKIGTGGNSSATLRGSSFTDVAGDSSTRIHGDASTRCLAGAAFSAGGSLSVDLGAKDGSAATLLGHGSIFATSEKELVLRATEGLRLVCGTSIIRLLPDRIELIADDVLVKGSHVTTLRGGPSIVELAGEARIASKATRLFGTAASLDLSTDAFLKGAHVHLGMREGDPPKAKDDAVPAETQALTLCLQDAAKKGHANRPCDVTVDGVRYPLTTDGSGNVTATIPASATEAHVSLWVGDPPTGERREWNLGLGKQEPANSLAGARGRLKALGFEVGVGEELDPATAKSLADFQEQHELPPTGEIDAATAGKLAEVHGH